MLFFAKIQHSSAELDSDREARRAAERERRREEHRERSRRRMEERRDRGRGGRDEYLDELEMRRPRSRRSRDGEEDGEDGLDFDIDEQIRKRHEERMRDRGHPSRSSGRRGRTTMDKKDAPKGIDDEGALYHLTQVKDKQNILRNRINKNPDKFSAELQAEIESDLAEYYKLEIIVAKNRQQMSRDYNKARDINDKTARRAYLDGLKDKREERRVRDKAARDVAREKYLVIKGKIDNVLDKDKK